MMKEQKPKAEKGKNPMNEIKIEKVVLSISKTKEELEKGVKLLKVITGRNPAKIKSTKRIPSFNVRPGLEVGCLVTIRKKPEELLKRLLETIDNKLKRKQISNNFFSFGIEEYIEIPGVEYQRDIGIMGFDVTVVFSRTGKRVKIKKLKRGKIPNKQSISKQEIIKFMEEKFKIEFKGK